MLEDTENCECRTTCIGLFNYALSYVEAARILTRAQAKTTHPDAPIRFLYYHAVELFLKSFLVLRGKTADEVRKEYGHEFTQLRRNCEDLGLVLDDEDIQVIDLIGSADTLIRARYIETGPFRWPAIEALDRTAASLEDRLRGALIQAGRLVR